MNSYSDKNTQAVSLAALVRDQLCEIINTSERAVLIVAGGSTPKLFLNALSKLSMEWSKVIVVPSDERWVQATNPRSNDRFIRENLLINEATEAQVVSLYVDDLSPANALAALDQRLSETDNYPSVCVLGMGEDAHIASLFPGANNLSAALDPDSNSRVMDILAPGADEPRITLTLARLLQAEHLHLLISGSAKLSTLEKARLPGSVEAMPVRSILSNIMMQIHYAD